ncbi:MAG: hypothetical protein RJA35_1060 [Actinomycetota bacterium]|jgi:hypothetical protein
MPRNNRPKGYRKPDEAELELNLDLIRNGVKRTEVKNGVPCYVQPTNGRSEDREKAWVCPNCTVPISWGTSHLVAWPVDLNVETRRHFHNRCWQMYNGFLG